MWLPMFLLPLKSTILKAQTVCKHVVVKMWRWVDIFLLIRHKYKSIYNWRHNEHNWSKMWRCWATLGFQQSVVRGIRCCCFTTGRWIQAGTCSRCHPQSISLRGSSCSSILCPCRWRWGSEEACKKRSSKMSSLQCSCRRVVRFTMAALTDWSQCTTGFLGPSRCKRPGCGSVSQIRTWQEVWDVTATLHASWKHWDWTRESRLSVLLNYNQRQKKSVCLKSFTRIPNQIGFLPPGDKEVEATKGHKQ